MGMLPCYYAQPTNKILFQLAQEVLCGVLYPEAHVNPFQKKKNREKSEGVLDPTFLVTSTGSPRFHKSSSFEDVSHRDGAMHNTSYFQFGENRHLLNAPKCRLCNGGPTNVTPRLARQGDSK